MKNRIIKRGINFFRPVRLGDRLAWYFISIGLVFTLAISISITEYEHIKYSEQVDKESRETVRAVKDQLERSLWNVDEESALILLDGLARSQSISGIRLVDENGLDEQLGDFNSPPDFTETLQYEGQRLGTLQITVNNTYLDERFIERIKLLGISAAVFIGLFGCFLQIIVRRLVTDHISEISI